MKEKNQYASLYKSQILKQVTERKNMKKIITVLKVTTGVWCYCGKTS